MKLVVISNVKIEIIEPKIIDLFSKIKNKNVIMDKINKFPFQQNNVNNDNNNNNDNNKDKQICMNLIKMIPIQDVDIVNIIWQIPNMDEFYEYKPLEYITHLMGHESEGSIYYFLKEHGYITSLSVGPFEQDSSVILFKIEIELTEKGFKYIPNIVECIYNYIDLIKKNGINRWIYNESKIINQLSFDYSPTGDKIDYVSELSMNMLKYKAIDILYGPYKLNDFDNNTIKLINNCLNFMKKENSIITILSKSYENTVNKKDKWYGAKYFNILMPNNLGSEFTYKKMNYVLHLPTKNKYIPKNVTLCASNELHLKDGKLIKSDNSKFELWYKKDNTFKIPKVLCCLIIYIDEHYTSAINYLIMEIYLRIIDEYLSSSMYYAKLCLTGYGIDINQNCITISFDGFNENIMNIITIFTHTLLNIKISEKIFNFIKYELKNELKNFIYIPGFMLINDYFKEKLYLVNYTNQDLLDIIHNIKFDDINKPKKWFSDYCFIKSFVYGNINETIITSIQKNFTMFACDNSNKINKLNKIIKLEQGEENIYIRKTLNKTDNNYVILVFFEFETIIKEVTKHWKDTAICAALIELYVKEKFFSQLRTKEQSGYIVRSSLQKFQDQKGIMLGISFLIQSPNINPTELRRRIRIFIEDIYVELKKLSNDKLILYKSILKNMFNKKFDSQYEEFNFINSEIISGEYSFNYKKILADHIDNINKTMLISFYNEYFINKTTRKIRILEMYKNM